MTQENAALREDIGILKGQVVDTSYYQEKIDVLVKEK